MTVEAVADLRVPPRAAVPPRWWTLSSLLRRFFSPQNRYLAPFLITCILLAAQLQYGVLESSPKPLLLAISVAIFVEVTLGRMVVGKFPHLASAYITGISVGIILRSPAFWPYALCSAVSIVSKYALRVRGRHLFNPSNFGISAMFFLYATHAAPLSVQWGNAVWAVLVIWLLGCIIVGRLRRFHITLTYVVSFVALAAMRCRINGQPFLTELTPITSAPYQLFIFFMITDPGTTVRARWGQVLTAFLVACLESVLRLRENVHAPYYALFIVFPIANLIELACAARSSRTAQTTASPASA
jgi:Na+-translocating ferredoxin:NAD+ oxidoreductase RnfD subunit